MTERLMTGRRQPSLTDRSARLFQAAQAVIPGGVNSPVRAFRSVGGVPRFIDRGHGAHLLDVDGNSYIDYVLSWGALPLGHAAPEVVAAVIDQARRGTTFGAPTGLETELAERIAAAVPSMDMIRFVSSGTEATMSAIRLARAATGRTGMIKFAGCYHGHADSLLVQAGSGVATLGLPDSPGVTPGAAADTLTARFNDLASVEALIAHHANRIAAVIVEPVAGNMGLVLPEPGFLAGLREICTRSGALLIFDEVMTGFRVAYGGAQGLFDVVPDLTCLGKVIGGGLPAAAYGGSRALMRRVAPSGPVYQAGTLSGNPLAMAAGLATLERLSVSGTYERSGAAADHLATRLKEAAMRAGVAMQVSAIGGMWGLFFSSTRVTDFDGARRADGEKYASFFHSMLEQGIYLPPSPFESAFVSTAHDEPLINDTVRAFSRGLVAGA
jgi:glutamate-1-semialdehyde 2,1-aminomutase